MFNWKIPEVSDREWMQPALSASGGMGSEFAFGTLYLWSCAYGTRVCQHDGWVLRCSGTEGNRFYQLPLGPGDLRSKVELLLADAKEAGCKFRLWGLTKQETEHLEEAMPGMFRFQLDRDASDYIYASQDLIHLADRKFHGKRNHLARFQRSYNWSYEDITPENYADCKKIAHEWCVQNGGCGKEDGTDDETCAINMAFRSFEELKLSGGLLRVDGKPVAFTVGEEINPEVYLLHFEKALSGYEGLYAAINHEYAANHLENYRYINREEDLGIEGLRKAKLSYNPAILLEKYSATLLSETEEITELEQGD